MKLKHIIEAIESLAPLRYQDEYDNSGLQVGLPDTQDITRVLVCLDVTESILLEAEKKKCGLIVSHHPLLFHALRQISDQSYQQSCVRRAILSDIAIYSAHTSLDNAPGGVNHKIAAKLGVTNLRWLSPHPDGESGSGLIGTLPEGTTYRRLLAEVKDKFGVAALKCSEGIWESGGDSDNQLRTIAICGGAGAFLLPKAIEAGADVFLCGEFHYHDYFENKGTLLIEAGHYQSEQFTIELLSDYIKARFPELEVLKTCQDTNPIQYL